MACRFRSVAVALAVALSALCVPALSVAAGRRPGVGTRLVKRFFTEIEQRDVAGLRAFLSPSFQIQRADGSRLTKTQYLRNLPTVISYKLRDVVTTSARNVLVVTYQAAASEVINGKKLSSGYAPRISVFVFGAHGWQIVAHANFNTPA